MPVHTDHDRASMIRRIVERATSLDVVLGTRSWRRRTVAAVSFRSRGWMRRLWVLPVVLHTGESRVELGHVALDVLIRGCCIR